MTQGAQKTPQILTQLFAVMVKNKILPKIDQNTLNADFKTS